MALGTLIGQARAWSVRLVGVLATPVERAVSVLVFVALSVPLWRFVSALPTRLNYPWELEWMEGGIVSHVQVLLQGGALYRAPSLSFTPFIYPPLYYYAAGLVAKVVGLGYFAPRLVSGLATLGCYALLFKWVWRETRSLLAGWVASGLYLATYDLSGRWFDIARGDSLLLLFLLLACTSSRSVSARAPVVTGVALALAFFTKQSAMAIAVPVLCSVLVASPQRGWITVATFSGLLALGCLLLEIGSKGWFSFYVFRVPADHEILWATWRDALFNPLWPSLAPMILASLAVACGVPSLRGGILAWPASGLLVLCAGAGSVLAALHTGGYSNVLMPAFAAMAMCSGLVFAHLRDPRARTRTRSSLLAAAVVVLQLALLSFGPTKAVPRNGDTEAGATLIAQLAALPGPIWCTASNYYPVLAGHHEPMTHVMGLVDVFKSKEETVKAATLRELERELSSGRIPTIVSDRAFGFLPDEIVAIIRRNYRSVAHLTAAADRSALWPNTGAAIRPDEIWAFKGMHR
jgi:hypothetical protein